MERRTASAITYTTGSLCEDPCRAANQQPHLAAHPVYPPSRIGFASTSWYHWSRLLESHLLPLPRLSSLSTSDPLTPNSSQPSSYRQLKLVSVTPVINFFIL
ncbi:hypothetical protein PCANC_24011 [Puccinia coronata f. sp. avenae]|uniref:Uncharacterized protein n=1 Tax=Puccinia coronata f. sp. avenae TaxID=200324 RepID=A0A2N5TX30_9BASI|nr:hypothetical protein PCANC_24011 [Puccinia coronata f. sp. avenae]